MSTSSERSWLRCLNRWATKHEGQMPKLTGPRYRGDAVTIPEKALLSAGAEDAIKAAWPAGEWVRVTDTFEAQLGVNEAGRLSDAKACAGTVWTPEELEAFKQRTAKKMDDLEYNRLKNVRVAEVRNADTYINAEMKAIFGDKKL